VRTFCSINWVVGLIIWPFGRLSQGLWLKKARVPYNNKAKKKLAHSIRLNVCIGLRVGRIVSEVDALAVSPSICVICV